MAEDKDITITKEKLKSLLEEAAEDIDNYVTNRLEELESAVSGEDDEDERQEFDTVPDEDDDDEDEKL